MRKHCRNNINIINLTSCIICYNYYYEGESNEKLKYFIPRNLLNTKGTAEQHGRYGVLIRDSYPDVRLFHSLLRGDYSFTMASTAAMDSGVTTRCA